MLWPKKIHTRNLITKKNPRGAKIPLAPITFLMVGPLEHSFSLYCLLFLVRSPPTYGVRHLSIA